MFGFLKRLFSNNDEQLKDFVARKAVIIDVRSPAEFKSGHAKNSINIPVQQINAQVDKIKGYQKPIIVCCASGMRSGSAAGLLRAKGVEVENGGTWQRVQVFYDGR